MKRCKTCDKPIKSPKANKSGLCSGCGLALASKNRDYKKYYQRKKIKQIKEGYDE